MPRPSVLATGGHPRTGGGRVEGESPATVARRTPCAANGTEAIRLRCAREGQVRETRSSGLLHLHAPAEAIPPTGAQPIFCDIDPDTYFITAETVRRALTPRTKAVVAVHLFGNMAPVREIEQLGVPVLEDAAQAAGSVSEAGRPGALGTAATFSFFPSKNLGAFGDGGMITYSDEEPAGCARTLRLHGSRDKVSYEQIGYNSRLTSCRRRSWRVAAPSDEMADVASAAPHHEDAGLGSSPPPRPRRLSARLAPVRDSDPTSKSCESSRRRSAPDRTTGRLFPSGRAMRRGWAPMSSPGTEQAARAPTRDPDEPCAHARAGGEVASRRGQPSRAAAR